MTKAAYWQNRILGEGEEAPDQLLANPRNWRIHPKAQQDALAGILSEVGWVQRVIVNQRTGHIIDGHLRVSLAISRQEPMVPVVYVDLSEDEERAVLASLDPLSAMAVADQAQLDALLAGVSVSDDALRAMLDGLRSEPNGGLTDRYIEPALYVLGPGLDVMSVDVAGRSAVLATPAIPGEDRLAPCLQVGRPPRPFVFQRLAALPVTRSGSYHASGLTAAGTIAPTVRVALERDAADGAVEPGGTVTPTRLAAPLRCRARWRRREYRSTPLAGLFHSFIITQIEPRYVDVAVKRWEAYTGKEAQCG